MMTNDDNKKQDEENNVIGKKLQYFDINVQNKIIDYQNAKVKRTKDRIYTKYIHPAFVELVNSLVIVYGFKSSNEEIEHLKSDCVSFLFETLLKYDASKGTKAFSYFNVVAKNWLTIQSRRLLKHKTRSAYIDDIDNGLSAEEKKDLFEKSLFEEDLLESDESDENLFLLKIVKILDYIDVHLKDERDKKCSIAIRKIYNDIDNIEFFNKRAIFVYLREISGLNSNELSLSLSNIRKIYRRKITRDNSYDLSKNYK